NFVPRCHRYRFIEVTRLNLPCALEQSIHGTGDSTANQHREHQSECSSNCRHNCRNPYGSLLIADNCLGAHVDLPQPADTHEITLWTDIIAKGAAPGEAMQYFFEIPSF